jgi:hypothetical protein
VDHGRRVWTESGKIDIPPVFKGGALLRAFNPTRFAVDFTHAFAYDSGPDTPRSPEYLDLLKEIESLPPVEKAFTPCSTEIENCALSLLPESCLESSLRTETFQAGGSLWVTVAQYNIAEKRGFLQLLQLTEDSEK